MRSIIVATLALLMTGVAAVAHAQSEELTCQDLTIPIVGVPDSVPFTFTVPPDDLIKRCTSATGSPITLVSPAGGVTVTPTTGSTQTIIFVVKDASGNEVAVNLTITRDQGNG